jgi:hypothetical protein
MVRLLIELGAAQPRQPDDSGALVPAMLDIDTPVLRALLEGGANPNPSGGACKDNNL